MLDFVLVIIKKYISVVFDVVLMVEKSLLCYSFESVLDFQ